MSLAFVRDAWEKIVFDAYGGPERILVFRTDAGPAVALPQLQRIFGSGPPAEAEEARKQLTGPHGLASRPISGPQTDALILLWEMLRIVPRGRLHPTENPPRVLALGQVEELASLCWEGSESTNLRDCYRDLTSAIERRLPEDFERCDVKVLHVDGARFFAFKVKRIEVPELSPWYCPIASIAECIYGNPRNTVSVRQEIGRRHPNLGEGSPHRWVATTKTLGSARFSVLARTLITFLGLAGEAGQENLGSARSWSFLSLEGTEQLIAKLPDRDPAFALAFKRASLAVRGMDPAEIDLMVPEPQPARRLAIFSREEWLTDSMMANVMTLLLHRMKPNALTKALYPASIDTVVSLLRRYAGMSEEKRKRRNLWHAVNGGLLLCFVRIGGVPGGTLKMWTTRGHWITLALDGESRRCRYFDSLGAPPDPRLKRAATKALPTFAWVTELPERLQVDGHSCGIWALWFGESVALEAATQYSWHEYLNDGSIGFLKSGEADKGGFGTKNARFIAERRKAYRTLLESAIVDTSDLRLFEIDEDVDSWAVALPASSRAPGAIEAAAAAAAASSSSSSSSASSESEAEGDGAGSEAASAAGSCDADGRPLTPIDRAASPAFRGVASPPVPVALAVQKAASPPGAGAESRQPYALSEGEFGRALRHQMAAYREWRQAPLNASRKGNAIENSSLQNDLGIIQRLLGYVRMREGLEGELTLDVMGRLDAVEIVLRFFRFLREERGTKPGTLVSYASTLINLAAFVAVRGGASAGSDGPHGQALRNLRNQLLAESKTEKKWRQRTNCVEFERVLRGRADAYEAFDAEEKPRQKAKHLRDCLLLGFLSISPARPGLLQHLKIGDTLRKDNGRWNMSILSMRIQDGPSEGALTHKTAKRHGAVVVPVAEQLQEPLTEYVENYRRHLLREGAKDQGYIFFTSAGEPFRRGSWTAFAKEAFCRWTGVPVPPRTMRAVVTTWVRDQAAKGRIEGDVATSVIEGTARLLQHTPKTATMHYDCHRTQREACAALAWLERAAAEHEGPSIRALEGPGRAALEGAKRAERAGTDDEEEEEEEEEEEGTEDEKGSESGGEDQDAAGEARGGAPGGGGGGGGSDEGEDGGSSDESSDEPKEGMRVERELARAEGRWCPECCRIFGTTRGKERHRCSPRKPAARGRSDREEVEEAEGSGGGRRATRPRKALRRALQLTPREPPPAAVPVPAPAAAPAAEAVEAAAPEEVAAAPKRGRGRPRGSRSSPGGRREGREGEMPPPPAPWHIRLITPSPMPARTVVAAMATRRGDLLPSTVFARLTATVGLASGQQENRFVILRRFGALWTPSNEGGPDDYSYPRAAVEVEYRATGGAVDVTTTAEEVLRRLAAAAQEPPRAEPAPGGRGSYTGRRRGRPPKNPRRGA